MRFGLILDGDSLFRHAVLAEIISTLDLAFLVFNTSLDFKRHIGLGARIVHREPAQQRRMLGRVNRRAMNYKSFLMRHGTRQGSNLQPRRNFSVLRLHGDDDKISVSQLRT
jgi:hypothetical protein